MSVQVLATHIERIKKSEEGKQQASDTDDEKVRQIGKQNLDKWLQVLLFNVESTPPGQASPLHRALSPALTQMSIAAMRGSLNLEANQDQVAKQHTKLPYIHHMAQFPHPQLMSSCVGIFIN